MNVPSLARYRKALPKAAKHVAQLVAVRDEDCGTCVEIGVRMAKKDGVPVEVPRAVVASRPEHLPQELADVYRFTHAVVAATWDEGELRDRIRSRWGDTALCELALAIASCRVFPILERALGYAESCKTTPVDV